MANTEWMSSLSQELQNVPLNKLAIPGSHCSFTWFLSKRGPLSPDFDIGTFAADNAENKKPKHQKISHNENVNVDKQSVQNWSRTQSMTFTQQLKAGIRYFDLQVARRPGTYDLYFARNLYGEKVLDALDEMKQFLKQHPKEIILLDFNHFYNMNLLDHQHLLRKLMRAFEERICPVGKLEDITLSYMWKRSLQVIIFYHEEEKIKRLPHFWSRKHLNSPGLSIDNLDDIVKVLDYNFQQKTYSDVFHLSHCFVEPQAKFVETRINETLRESVAKPSLSTFLSWIKQQNTKNFGGVNIITKDFVDLGNFIPTVIQLNNKK